MNKISIRNSKYAIRGLLDLIEYVNINSIIKTKDMTMVEVGSYVGDSTKVFAENFKTVISIDPYLNGYDDGDASSYTVPMKDVENQFLELCKEYSNITKLKLTSKAGASTFIEDHIFDLVYIDGNHKSEYVKEDLLLWIPKIKDNCWIGGHDYGNKNAPEVAGVIDSYLGKPDQIFKDTSWIKRIFI